MKKNIIKNKGQFILDTYEKMNGFSDKLSSGWQKEYKTYRDKWIKLPENKEVREYPLLVDLELSTICNLKCPMCYTTTDSYKNKISKGLMDFNLFTKIIDEIAGKVFSVRLSLRGEPTLHPDFIKAIKYAKDKGIKEVSCLTNASKLKLSFFKEVVKAGLDWISISFDGIGDTYNAIRKPLKFDDTYEKIKDIFYYKKKHNLIKPVIKIQTIWPAIKDNPEEFYNLFTPYVDLIAYNPLIDFIEKDKDIIYDHDFSCSQLYQRLIVGTNGNAMMCSNDEYEMQVIGNANDQTIKEIWHGEKLNKIREIHKEKDGFKNIEVCRNCYYPRTVEVSGEIEINSNKFYINDYKKK